jgi:ribosomal protein S6
MPTYELSLVVKQALKRPDMVAAVKRTGESIINNGGYIRNLEFLGHRNLPQRQRVNDEYHTKGSYFIMKIDIPKPGEILNYSAVTAPFHDLSIEKFSAKK